MCVVVIFGHFDPCKKHVITFCKQWPCIKRNARPNNNQFINFLPRCSFHLLYMSNGGKNCLILSNLFTWNFRFLQYSVCLSISTYVFNHRNTQFIRQNNHWILSRPGPFWSESYFDFPYTELFKRRFFYYYYEDVPVVPGDLLGKHWISDKHTKTLTFLNKILIVRRLWVSFN